MQKEAKGPSSNKGFFITLIAIIALATFISKFDTAQFQRQKNMISGAQSAGSGCPTFEGQYDVCKSIDSNKFKTLNEADRYGKESCDLACNAFRILKNSRIAQQSTECSNAGCIYVLLKNRDDPCLRESCTNNNGYKKCTYTQFQLDSEGFALEGIGDPACEDIPPPPPGSFRSQPYWFCHWEDLQCFNPACKQPGEINPNPENGGQPLCK